MFALPSDNYHQQADNYHPHRPRARFYSGNRLLQEVGIKPNGTFEIEVKETVTIDHVEVSLAPYVWTVSNTTAPAARRA